jgi:two-component sensor histidine kinase
MQVVRSVRTALLATALLFAASLIVLRGVSLWLERHYVLERAEATTRDMTLILEEYAKRTFETSDHVLREIARYVGESGGASSLRDSEAAHRFLLGLTRESSSGDFFLVVDRDGVPSALTSRFPPPDVSLRDQDWFQQHVDGANRVVGRALVGRITGEILFTYTHRLLDAEGRFDGAVQVAVRPTFFQEITRGATPEDGEIGRDITLAMWGADGQVIARTGLAPANVDQSIATSPLFQDLLASPSGTFRDEATIEGGEAVVSFRRLERWPVVVTASMPISAVLGPWWVSLAWSLAGLAIGCAGLAWLTFAGLRLARADEASQVELREANANLNKALADKVVLLQEIHHRVKNNLAITSSLLSLQARRLTDPEARKAFRDTEDRLRSVALIHEALYRSDASGSVRLDEYLHRLVSEVAIAHGAAERAVALSVSAEPIEMPLEQAVPLALAVTEALTNAFKHAFPEGAGGQISVNARSTGAFLEVTVRDNGQGFAANRDAAPRQPSLGAKLIETFAGQIGASTSYAHDGGTVFRMLVPQAIPAE